jgi:hypothetical protein
MNLAEFFHAINHAGVRLANSGGQLELRGPASSITPDLRAAAAEHKATILALLPATQSEPTADPASPQSNEQPAHTEPPANNATGGVAATTIAAHDWRDWRFEWLAELAQLFLRMRNCKDESVLARLRPLADASPRNLSEWLVLGGRIRNIENDLRLAGKLPAYHWPDRGNDAVQDEDDFGVILGGRLI